MINLIPSGKIKWFILSSLFVISNLTISPLAKAADEFIDLQCLSDVKTKDICNVSFFSKFMRAKFPRSGRTTKINYSDIVRWNYSDASLRKMDVGLARRIGIIGLLFTKVEHMHVFTIIYKDDFGDRQTLLIDFDDNQHVNPMKAALSDSTEVR
jgi:hypothetical protein